MTFYVLLLFQDKLYKWFDYKENEYIEYRSDDVTTMIFWKLWD